MKKKPGTHRCDECGRIGLYASAHKSGAVAFHYAPSCLLPCAGGKMPSHLDSEDLADGIHSKRKCPKCRKQRTA